MPRGIVAGLSGGSSRAQQLDELLRLDRLGEVQVEAGSRGARLVGFLAPAGDRDQQDVFRMRVSPRTRRATS